MNTVPFNPGSKTIIELSKDYRLHLSVKEFKKGSYSVRLGSQWLGAKDPKEVQTRYQVTLTKKQVLDLTQTLLEGTR